MQGTVSAEAQAAGEARADASGATAYLNLESGDCHGDDSAVRSLLQSGVSRVVMGEFVHLLRGARCRSDGSLDSHALMLAMPRTFQHHHSAGCG